MSAPSVLGWGTCGEYSSSASSSPVSAGPADSGAPDRVPSTSRPRSASSAMRIAAATIAMSAMFPTNQPL